MELLNSLLQQSEFLVRIVIAGLCGAVIGFERKNRMKVAGIRTHLMVSLAAALMMVVSKYGFFDLLIHEGIKLDPSRVAAGIVTGVSFLSAGLILVRSNNEVSGVTTSAGVWATVGIGMTIGSGMYFIGISSTILILLFQFILHRKFKFLREPLSEEMEINLTVKTSRVDEIRSMLLENNIEIVSTKIHNIENDETQINIVGRFPADFKTDDIISLCRCMPEVSSLEVR